MKRWTYRLPSNRQRLGAGVALAFGVLAAACSGSGSSSTSSSAVTSTSGTTSAPDTTSPATSVDVSGVTLTYAYTTTRGKGFNATLRASGEFDNLPFSLKWAEFPNNEDAMAAMLGDRVDMQETQPSSLAVLLGSAETPWTTENAPIRVIGALRRTTQEGIQIVVPSDSPVQSVADLRGKRVVFARGSQAQYYLYLELTRAGLKPSDVTPIKMKLSEARAAFAAGEVDAIVAFDYNLVSLFREQSLRVVARSADSNVPLYALLVVRANRLSDPAWVESFRIMLGRVGAAEGWAADNIDTGRRLREELDGMNPLDSEASARLSTSVLGPITDDVIAAVQAQADLFYAEGIIERLPDMSVIFDRTYLAAG